MSCKHERITVVYKHHRGTFFEPPDDEILHCICDDCGEDVDYDEEAEIDEVDWKDWY